MTFETNRIDRNKSKRRRSFMAQPFKHPASGVYYLRRKVPPELRQSLGSEYKRSLKTREPDEAKRRFAHEWAKSDEFFALARAQADGGAQLSQSDLTVVASRWAEAELARMEASGDYTSWIVLGAAQIRESGAYWEEFQPAESIREALAEDPEAESFPHEGNVLGDSLDDL